MFSNDIPQRRRIFIIIYEGSFLINILLAGKEMTSPDRLYQVFLSSTYEDLRAERSAAITAFLETDCVPVGMEYFPAADTDQWTAVKRLIDASDYYVLITAARYGSVEKFSGLSYTELEYDYAIKAGVPCWLSFITTLVRLAPNNTNQRMQQGKD